MSGHPAQCCGRTMNGIGLEREDGVVLRTCAGCGRHAWFAGDRELDRTALLAALRRQPQPSRPAPASRRAAAVKDDKRTELQDLLRRFTVHGSSS